MSLLAAESTSPAYILTLWDLEAYLDSRRGPGHNQIEMFKNR
jgi:hypothetical protein